MALDTLVAVEEAAKDDPLGLVVAAVHAGGDDPVETLLHGSLLPKYTPS